MIEVDLLYHSGESAKGKFAYTLTATEIVTDWTKNAFTQEQSDDLV